MRSARTNVSDGNTFCFSEIEAQRMRRGSLLFPLLVLPFAAIFGLDASKSQPTHFIIIMSIAALISGIFVAIGRAGANAQIRNARATSLTVASDRLIWDGNFGHSEKLLRDMQSVTAIRRRDKVVAIIATWSDGKSSRIEAYERMDELFEGINVIFKNGRP